MAKEEITINEIIKAIQEISNTPNSDGAATTREIAAAAGLGVKRIRFFLQQLMEDNKIERCWAMKDTLAGPRQILAFRWRQDDD